MNTHKISVGTVNPVGAVSVDRFPDRCPKCHKLITPQIGPLAAPAALRIPNGSQFAILAHFTCNNVQCSWVFLCSYSYNPEIGVFELSDAQVHEDNAQLPDWATRMSSVSPRFLTIYRQALVADAAGLHEISGMGFRKALEFLVKDFAAAECPTRKESILSQPLAAVIANEVEIQEVKSAAKRAAWLGNDESHYLRAWPDKDVHSLKALIEIVAYGIHQKSLLRQFEQDMPEPPKSSTGKAP